MRRNLSEAVATQLLDRYAGTHKSVDTRWEFGAAARSCAAVGEGVVEAAGIEPASASPTLQDLHA